MKNGDTKATMPWIGRVTGSCSVAGSLLDGVVGITYLSH